MVTLPCYKLVILHQEHSGLVFNSGLLYQNSNVGAHLCNQAWAHEKGNIDLKDYHFVDPISRKRCLLAKAVVKYHGIIGKVEETFNSV